MSQIEYIQKENTDKELFDILHPIVKKWFKNKFGSFCIPQKYGVMQIHKEQNILISSPTGSGKTLTAFLSILNELITLSEAGVLEDKTYAIYTSPLKALVHDVNVNLINPLKEIEELAEKEFGIRIAARTGDTTASERQKMVRKVPHILITTPESLSIILTSTKFREHLSQTKYMIVDEIHALADSKRGTHLSLSLERLQRITSENLTRIGLSATISPLDEIAQFLVGLEKNKPRPCKIVDIQFIKKMDLKVLSPVPDIINIEPKKLHTEMYKLIDSLIQDHKTTLIFTNTRSATERVVDHLKEKFPQNYSENIGAHHGSLSKKHRLNIENSLREGKLKAVVCSTSLELGIDIGYIDLVILLGSPKSVARALQRCLPYNAKVLTSEGNYVEIGKIVEEKLPIEIISYDNKKGFIKNKIVNYIKNNSEALYSIKIKSEETIKCTKDHPILTKEGWKKAEEITKKDKIGVICYKINFNNKEPYIYELLPQEKIFIENRNNFYQKIIDKFRKENSLNVKKFSEKYKIPYSRLIDCRRLKGRRKSIRLDYFLNACKIAEIPKSSYIKYLKNLKTASNFRNSLPLKLTKDLMWLAGIIATDGCIVKHKDKKRGTVYYHIKIGNRSERLLKEAKKILNKYGFKCHQYTREIDNFTSLECGSNLLSFLMFSLGIKHKNKTKNIEVGEPIFSLSPELQHAYLEGVFEGDGNFNRRYSMIRIFTASKKFAMGLHSLLNRLGYNNNVNKYKSKTSKLIKIIKLKDIYCISVTKHEDTKKLLNSLPIYGDKARNSKKIINKIEKKCPKNLSQQEKYIHWLDIKEIKKIKYNNPTYNLTLQDPNNNFIVGNIITHNCGRSGHKLHETSKGRIIVLDRDDLVECSVLLKSAIEKKIDKIHIPTNCLDVLAQQIYGIAISDQISYEDLYKLVKQAYPYKDLTVGDFKQIIEYLSGEYTSLEDRHIYAKIWYDQETGMIGKKGKLARVIYMTNTGTIPDESFIIVKVGEEIVGHIDEMFLERLKRGDVFTLGGSRYMFLFSRGMTAQARPAPDRQPTIPSWFSEMLPLSFDLALEIGKFRRLLEEKFKSKKKKEEIVQFILDYVYVDKYAADAIYNYFQEQFLYKKEIPHDKKIVVEHYFSHDKKYVIFHSLYGRRVNDVLSRAIAFAISKMQHKDVEIGINDNGFFLASKSNIPAIQALKKIKSEELEKIMDLSIEKTQVLSRRFRHVATRALMILREYKGKRKNVGRQQVSSMILLSALKRISPNFSIIKETKREVLEDLMDINSAKKVLQDIEREKIEIKEISTTIPSPFAFNLIVQAHTDIYKIEDKLEFIQRMHNLVMAKIGKDHKIE